MPQPSFVLEAILNFAVPKPHAGLNLKLVGGIMDIQNWHLIRKVKFRFNQDIWASTRENLSSGFANNNDEVQPANARIRVSAFVIRLLEFIISRLA